MADVTKIKLMFDAGTERDFVPFVEPETPAQDVPVDAPADAPAADAPAA